MRPVDRRRPPGRLARPRSARVKTFACVGLGGGIGAWARYEIELRFGMATPPGFPFATLAINVTGAFLLGLLVALVVDYWPPTRYVRPFAAIGVLGGFTTFSTFMVEFDRLLGARRLLSSGLYLGGSLGAGLVAVTLGSWVAHMWPLLMHRTGRGPGR